MAVGAGSANRSHRPRRQPPPCTPNVEAPLPKHTLTTPSIRLVSRLPGMNPAPMPWILWGPGAPPLITGDSVGSTAMICS